MKTLSNINTKPLKKQYYTTSAIFAHKKFKTRLYEYVPERRGFSIYKKVK